MMKTLDTMERLQSWQGLPNPDRDEVSSQERYVRLVSTVFLVPGIFLLVLFGVKNALYGVYIESALNLGTAFFLFGIIYTQRLVKRVANLCRASLLVLAVLFYYTAVLGGETGYKILWINLFPLAAFFLLGNREGLLWSLTFLLGILILLSDANTLIHVYRYPADFRIRIHLVYLCLTALMYVYETARRYFQEELDHKQRQLVAEKEKLVSANREIAASNSRIRQSEEQYRLLVDNSHDGIFIVQDSLLRFANPRIRHFFGIDEYDPLDCPLIDFLHAGDREVVMGRYRRRIAGKDPTNHYVFRIVNRIDEKVRWVRINAKRIDWNDRPAVISFCHDITQTKALETQLLQAQKMQAIGTLAGGIAHDFNNMLSAIIGYTEMVMTSSSADTSVTSRLDRVLEASHRARELIGQILAFSRQQKEEHRPVAIAPVVQEALKLIETSTVASVELIREIDEDAGVVVADPVRVHQIVMNLCTNGLQAMGEASGRLEVSLDRFDYDGSHPVTGIELPPGAFVRLRIADSGCGMDRQTLQRIFDPYFTTKSPGEGTGLGLSVVHGIVKSLNGAIAPISSPGEGTVFEVYFPRVDTEAADSAPLNRPCPGGSETILLVDDEEIVADITREILESLGYTVVARVSSIEAYNAFIASPDRFHAVITDHTMPKMTGLELAKKISAVRSALPVILCTGFSMKLTPGRLREAGVDILLNKPLLRYELASALRESLDKNAPVRQRKEG